MNNERGCQYISKNIPNAWKLLFCDGFCVCSTFFCTLRYTVRQRAYVIYNAIIYSKRPLLRLRPLPSNNESSAVRAYFWWYQRLQSAVWLVPGIDGLYKCLKTPNSNLYIVSKRRQSLAQQKSQLGEQTNQHIKRNRSHPVSYTHLTLPTILRV